MEAIREEDQFSIVVAGPTDLLRLTGICEFLQDVSVSDESTFTMSGTLVRSFSYDPQQRTLAFTPTPFIAAMSSSKTGRSFLEALATPFLRSGQLNVDHISEVALDRELQDMQEMMQLPSSGLSTSLTERIADDNQRDPLDALKDAIVMLEVAELRWKHCLFSAMQTSPTLRDTRVLKG